MPNTVVCIIDQAQLHICSGVDNLLHEHDCSDSSVHRSRFPAEGRLGVPGLFLEGCPNENSPASRWQLPTNQMAMKTNIHSKDQRLQSNNRQGIEQGIQLNFWMLAASLQSTATGIFSCAQVQAKFEIAINLVFCNVLHVCVDWSASELFGCNCLQAHCKYQQIRCKSFQNRYNKLMVVALVLAGPCGSLLVR